MKGWCTMGKKSDARHAERVAHLQAVEKARLANLAKGRATRAAKLAKDKEVKVALEMVEEEPAKYGKWDRAAATLGARVRVIKS
jgi:hypothetical protein